MTSRYQDNFRHTSLKSSPSAPSTRNSSVASSVTLKENNASSPKTTKWYNPANLLKISPEPVNPWRSDPFSSSNIVGKEESRRASIASQRLPDYHRGYLGKEKLVGYYKA